LTPLDLPAVTPRVESALATDNILDLTLDTEMTPDARYEVWAHGVEDRVGNGCAPPFDRVTVRGFRPERPSNRRFDLWEMLPRFNRREDTTGDLWRLIACLQDVTDLLLADIDRMSDRWDIDRATERDLDLILQDIGNPFDISLDLTSKRRLAGCLVAMYRDKGTARGIRDAVRFFLGIEVQIVTFTDTSMRLGESALNDDWELGTDDRRLRFAFSVRAPRLLTQTERDHIACISELPQARAHPFMGHPRTRNRNTIADVGGRRQLAWRRDPLARTERLTCQTDSTSTSVNASPRPSWTSPLHSWKPPTTPWPLTSGCLASSQGRSRASTSRSLTSPST
jgi:phage tail-like protein